MASSNDKSIAASSSFSFSVQTTALDAMIAAEISKISGLVGNSKHKAVSFIVTLLTSLHEGAACLFILLLAASAFTTA